MNQNEAPIGTVATIGHPANRILIVKSVDRWRYVNTGDVVDPEDFRAGWDDYVPVPVVPGTDLPVLTVRPKQVRMPAVHYTNLADAIDVADWAGGDADDFGSIIVYGVEGMSSTAQYGDWILLVEQDDKRFGAFVMPDRDFHDNYEEIS